MRHLQIPIIAVKLAYTMMLAWALIGRDTTHASTPSVVVGQVKSQEALDFAPPCPPDDKDQQFICMDSWFRWTLQIDRTLAGPTVKGRISTAHLQHAHYVKWFLRSVRLFVITPIEDMEERRRLRADYFLEDFSRELPMYCLNRNPADLGLQIDGVSANDPASGTYCFQNPESVQRR